MWEGGHLPVPIILDRIFANVPLPHTSRLGHWHHLVSTSKVRTERETAHPHLMSLQVQGPLSPTPQSPTS